MSGSAGSPVEQRATIQISRGHRLYQGVGAKWLVFIDGVWVGKAPNSLQGRVVTFTITAGSHIVKIWSKHGASCSNELALDLVSETTRRLICDVNPVPLGIQNLPKQLTLIRNVFRDGGIAKGAIVLYEDPGLLNT